MKKSKTLLVLSTSILVLSACSGGNSGSTSSSSGTSSEVTPPVTKTVDLYGSAEHFTGEKPPLKIAITIFDNIQEVPYFAFGNIKDMLDFEFNTEFQYSNSNNVYTWKNVKSNHTMSIDSTTSVISFSDYNGFRLADSSPTYLNTDISSDPAFKIVEGSNKYNVENKDTKVSVKLSDYGYTLKSYSSECYVPANLFLAAIEYDYNYVYNGKGFFLNKLNYIYDNEDKLTPYGEKVLDSSISFNENSRKLAYYSLCIQMDTHFGVKSLLGGKKLDTFLAEKGYKDKLLNAKDALEFDNSLAYIFKAFLNDNGHTYLNKLGMNIFNDEPISINVPKTEKEQKILADYEGIVKIRRGNTTYYKGSENTTIAYQEGKNYIISFNSFMHDLKTDKPQESTILLMKIANEEIQTTPTIENVIIDLSLNGGGEDLAELAFESWVKGEATQYLRSTTSNIYAETAYKYDVNGDGNIDDKDTIKNKKIYVITSLYTYSNGNVFSGMVKDCANVVMVGNDTSGGSCNTVSVSTSIGNAFNYSSTAQAVYKDHSSFEEGVLISKAENKFGSDYSKYIDYLNITKYTK